MHNDAGVSLIFERAALLLVCNIALANIWSLSGGLSKPCTLLRSFVGMTPLVLDWNRGKLVYATSDS